MSVKCVEKFLHKEVPVYVFEVLGESDWPAGFYFTSAVFFDDLDPGEAALFNPRLTGVFRDATAARTKAITEIDQVAKMMDAEEEVWEFVEE